MPTEFRPGFRFSWLDALVLVSGALGAYWLWPEAPWLGFIIAFVVGHFFLFCNVFRIARNLELLWAIVFVVLAQWTLKSESSAWKIPTALSLATTVIVIGIELRKPSYHGIGWRRINPNLREWWDASV